MNSAAKVGGMFIVSDITTIRASLQIIHNFAELKDAAVRGGPPTNNFRKI